MGKDLLQQFGSQVRALRKQAGMSQMELGEKAGLDHTYIGGVERGERNLSLEAIAKIADGLGKKIPELFLYTGAVRAELMDLVTLLEHRDVDTIQHATELVRQMIAWVDAKS